MLHTYTHLNVLKQRFCINNIRHFFFYYCVKPNQRVDRCLFILEFVYTLYSYVCPPYYIVHTCLKYRITPIPLLSKQ